MSQYSRSPKKVSPQVYRRRRIAALVALLVAIALIWSGVSAVIGALTGGNTTPTPMASASAPESNVEVEAGQECPPGTVFVEALVGNESGESMMSFKSSETPYIWFSLTNTNNVDCTFNAGSSVQFFNITSGEQLIWTSEMCDRSELTDGNVVLVAGETISSPPQPWEKVFSSESGCGADQEPVVTGGASYHLKVEVNGELSKNSVQFVLN
jgi:hypothetical protein